MWIVGDSTLRDQFAMAALPAVVGCFGEHAPQAATHENIAKESYLIADAMMAERSKDTAIAD